MSHEQKRERWEKARARLADQVRGVLAGVPGEVNLSVPRHSITCAVLRRLAFDRALAGRGVPVVYADASKPAPFPVGELSDGPAPPAVGPIVKLGLASFRHPDLDYLVDRYLIRNRDANAEPTMAAEEEMTCRRTVELLSDPVLRAGGRVWAFHTGLEPMVVGFYRGVGAVLRDRRRRGLPRALVVTPFLYALDSSVTAAIGPDSPGARLDSYIREQPWW